jgi:hypothetical protein
MATTASTGVWASFDATAAAIALDDNNAALIAIATNDLM